MATPKTLSLRFFILTLLTVSFSLACIKPPPAEPKPKPKVDPYAEFQGVWFEAEQLFRIQTVPAANRNLEIEIALKKVEWTSTETRDGDEIRDASVILLVTQHGQTRRLRMDEGDSKTTFNITVEVKKAGEDYSESRMTYVPWVDLIVR